MLAAPLDGFAGTPTGSAPAPWIAGTWVAIGATPLNRYFGLAHLRDVNYTSGAALANWTKLGLVSAFGPPELQDGNDAPYGGGQTHLLLTNLTPQGGACPTPGTHRSVAEDLCTPLLADGSPALRQAWTYLLTLPYDAQFDTP